MDKKQSQPLPGYQKKYLRGLAHSLKPVVLVGQKGTTPTLIKTVEAALMAHELIKVRFIEFKDREQKEKIIDEMIAATKCDVAGTIGHTAILFRPHPNKDKRRIVLPRKKADSESNP